MGTEREQQTITVPFTRRSEWLAFGGALLLVVGSFMKWAVAGPFSVSGTDAGGDGWLTVIGGVAAGVQVWRARWLSAAVWGAGGLAVVVMKFTALGDVAEDSILQVEPGGGLYLCGMGAVMCAGAAGLRWWRSRSEDQRPDGAG